MNERSQQLKANAQLPTEDPVLELTVGNKPVDLQKIIDAKANINLKDNNGQTPLMAAAWYGHEECLQILIDSKAHLNEVSNKKTTAVIVAAMNGKHACLQRLVAAKADLNCKNPNDNTPLIIAMLKRHDECLQVLIESKADLNIKNKHGNTALMIAAFNNCDDYIQKLLDAKANINLQGLNGFTALSKSVERGHELSTKILIKRGAALGILDKNGKEQLILLKDSNMQEIKECALRSVVEFGCVSMAKLLVEQKATVNVKKSVFDSSLHSPILDIAVEKGDIDVVKLLLSHGAVSTSQTLKKSEKLDAKSKSKEEVESFFRTKKYLQAMQAIINKDPQTVLMCSDLKFVDQKDLYQFFEKNPLNEKGNINKLFSNYLEKAKQQKEEKALPPSVPIEFKQHIQVEGTPRAIPNVEEQPGHPDLLEFVEGEAKSIPSLHLASSVAFFGKTNPASDFDCTNRLLDLIRQNPDYWARYPNGNVMKNMLETFCQNVKNTLENQQEGASPRI